MPSTKLSVTITMVMDDLVYTTINGINYVYCLDRALHDTFLRKLKRTPGKALSFIKARSRWCEKEI